jgi:hypothetical protein
MGAAIFQRIQFALLRAHESDRLSGKGGCNDLPSFDLM